MFQNYFTNPYAHYIKKYLYEILKEKYLQNEKFVDRISSQLNLENDAQDFVKLCGDIFEKGYLIAVDQHKEALSKIGMNVSILSPNQEQNSNKIFQSEKSG